MLLEERFGALGRAYGDASDQDEEDVQLLSSAKNANLDLSLAISSQGWAHRDEVYLSWFRRHELDPPASIIDVGCDNGFLTCAYARFHPQADVVGIDICPQGVECAKELATRLGLSNVEFFCADALNLPGHLAARTFSLVTSTSVACHVGRGFKKPVRSIEEGLAQPADSRLAASARTLSGKLADEDSTLISIEPVEDPANLAIWCRAIHDAGIGIRWDETDFLSFSMWEDKNTLAAPVLVGWRGPAELVQPDELRRWWWARSNPNSGEPLQALSDATAEAVFGSLDSPRFVKGFRYRFDAVFQHLEFWRLDSLAIRYWYTSRAREGFGIRQLAFGPPHELADPIHSSAPRSTDPDVRDVAEYYSPEDADGMDEPLSTDDVHGRPEHGAGDPGNKPPICSR